MPPAKFTLKTTAFEGPLDLLLSLIEKRKLLINDISLAQVTDDYIEHVKRLEHFPIADSAHFILIASTLLLIKSKSLLPTLALSEEEQGNVQDLETRLKLYQKFKALGLHIAERFGASVIFSKTESRNVAPVFSPEADITATSMLACIKNVLHNMPKKEAIPKAIVRKIVSLEEMITNLTERVKGAIRMSFKEFAGKKTANSANAGASAFSPAEKTHIVVSFLAMLELVKQGIINVTQDAQFSDILMETDEIGVPRYN